MNRIASICALLFLWFLTLLLIKVAPSILMPLVVLWVCIMVFVITPYWLLKTFGAFSDRGLNVSYRLWRGIVRSPENRRKPKQLPQRSVPQQPPRQTAIRPQPVNEHEYVPYMGIQKIGNAPVRHLNYPSRIGKPKDEYDGEYPDSLSDEESE